MATIRNQTKVVDFLDPFINDSTTPILIHLRPKDGVLVNKGPRLRIVATGLRQEDRDREVFHLIGEAAVARDLIGRLATPFIDIKAKEVNAVIRIGAAG